jgi:hypothetical protein
MQRNYSKPGYNLPAQERLRRLQQERRPREPKNAFDPLPTIVSGATILMTSAIIINLAEICP